MLVLLLLLAALPVWSQAGDRVLLVVNGRDPVSRRIGEYYRPRRSVPAKNVCSLETTTEEEISWDAYQAQIERPVARCLQRARLEEQVFYIVTTLGIPLKISGNSSGIMSEQGSVDSELALLYGKLKGARYERAGGLANPFFGRRDEPFVHSRFPIYLVTRLAGWDFDEVKNSIDRSLAARNRGTFVVDLNGPGDGPGNDWLRTAALLLPAGRVLVEESSKVVQGARGVIGYASWGSNDANRKQRWLGFEWLPGAVVAEFVSTDGRTMHRPPNDWTFQGWADRQHWFGGSSQGLSADYLHEGATGVSGNVYEPYLTGCVRPDYLLPEYFRGRNLAESYYLGLPYLSWQGIVLGDPLCSLGKP